MTLDSVLFHFVAEPEHLFRVMQSMHEMKLPPLRGGQRTQNGMVEQIDSDPEARLGIPNYLRKL